MIASMTTTMVDGVDALLERARAGMRRLDPHETRAAVAAGALLIDTRTDRQRARQGDLPGAIVVDRTDRFVVVDVTVWKG